MNIMSTCNAYQFKVGDSLYGMLRPDKIVAYFTDQENMSKAAESLNVELNGTEPHGVPFTAALAGDGLLSWGIDPPRAEAKILDWQERQSWRLWITNKLARFLIMSKDIPGMAGEHGTLALARLALEGVNTESWTPAPNVWGI